MTNLPYRFDVDRTEILTHSDKTSHLLMWGTAIDPASEEDEFDLKLNGQPVIPRIRRLRNPAIDSSPGARPQFVLRVDLPETLSPQLLSTMDITFNQQQTRHFEVDYLRASYNHKGFDYSIDLVDVRNENMVIGGWLLAVDPEDLKIQVLDAEGKPVKDVRMSFSIRFDVRRFYWVTTEKLCGFNVLIRNIEKVAQPVRLLVSNAHREWLISAQPDLEPEPLPEPEPEPWPDPVPVPEPPAPRRTPLSVAKGGVRRIKHGAAVLLNLHEDAPEKAAQAAPAPSSVAEPAPEPLDGAKESGEAEAFEPIGQKPDVPTPEPSASSQPAHNTESPAGADASAFEAAEAEKAAEKAENFGQPEDGPELLEEEPKESEQAQEDPEEKTISLEEVTEDFNDYYNRWYRRRRTSAQELEAQRKTHFDYEPLISLIVAAYNTPIDLLEKMIDSVREQTYSNWQLCISDGSSSNAVQEYLESHPDPKISWVRLEKNLGISGNMNAAAELAKGDVIALYDHDDFLEPDTLFEVVKAFNEHDYDYIYTDEDKYEDSTGRFVGPNFKPDYSPALLQSTNYICHFLAMKKEAYDRAGGTLRSEYDGAQDFDLMLRLMDTTDPKKVGHIPKILYHWRMHDGSTALDAENKLWAYEAGQKALEDWSRRNNKHGHIIDTEIPGHYHMRFDVPEKPMVSIIIPNKDLADDLDFCVTSIEKMSDYRNFEIIIVENNSEKRSTFRKYRELKEKFGNIRVLSWPWRRFNYSAINNFGARHAKGEYLLFLNNDTEAIDANLLTEMVGQAVQPNVGAVGAKLYYEDATFQHNGVIIGHSGVAGHGLIGQTDININYRVRTTYNVSAVTGACMMVPKKVFREVGGFRRDLPVAYNDVDLCLRIRQKGYWIVQNPFAMMFHYESRSRGYENTPEKQARFENDVRKMYRLWPDVLRTPDPFYNPNYDINNISYQLREEDEINSWINPVFLGEDYYTAGTIRPPKPTPAQMERLRHTDHLKKFFQEDSSFDAKQ